MILGIPHPDILDVPVSGHMMARFLGSYDGGPFGKASDGTDIRHVQ